MIMMGDKKNRINAILGPESPGVGIKGEEEGPDELGKTIASELLDAFHAKDAQGVWDALKAAIQEIELSKGE